MRVIISELAKVTAVICVITSCSSPQEPASKAPKPEFFSASIPVIGDGCETCELMYEGMPDSIAPADTSDGWLETGQKLIITGTIYQPDAKTPAKDITLYYWHTDTKGYYTPGSNTPEKAKPHGRMRGWVKTGSSGQYTICTLRPAPYPDENIPAHIHFAIKDPAIPYPYYPDDIKFDDDPLLLADHKKYPPENRCGSGIARILIQNDKQIAERDFILGLNVPHYPHNRNADIQSGLNIAEDQPSFIPYHAFGPDKDTQTCPVCKYGRYLGILYFAGEKENQDDLKKWLTFLDNESRRRGDYLKVYLVYGNTAHYTKIDRTKALQQLGQDLNLKHIALTFVPSFNDKTTEVHLNKINPNVHNTFVIYRHRRIVEKFINFTPIPEHFMQLTTRLDSCKGPFFTLPEIPHD